MRQLVFGKRFYRDELGIDSQVLWLPDTFGYSAVLPQLLAGCGVRYLVTQKIFWSYNEGDPFPYHYFNWKGMDGSQVVSFSAYQLHLPDRSEGIMRRLEKAGAKAASGRFPDPLRLRRRRRRPVPGPHRVCPAGTRP